MKIPAVLAIAGSDSSGGAGVQADIKTMLANGVYAMSAVTALTAQNTMGVTAVAEVTQDFLGQEIDAVFDDIVPDAVKIGMVSSSRLIKVIAGRLAHYKARNVVVDPVMVATSGARLIADEAVDALMKLLFPLAAVITPNIPELAVISSVSEAELCDEEARARVSREIVKKHGCAVLAKGGHGDGNANDVLVTGSMETKIFEGRRIETKNTHGTGCTLSSAIAANLAKHYDIIEAVGRAKRYVTGALAAGLEMGHGHGPMHHGFDLKSEFLSDVNGH